MRLRSLWPAPSIAETMRPRGLRKTLINWLHLPAHIGMQGAGVWKAELAGGVAGKCVGDESGLIRPPAIDGGFADSGVSGHSFDSEV